ncbi:hypothetical protein [Brevundimonas subvibrioides]|uniref:Uncharacterized protein n=1 Tax=Brevundimonas subvibrioides (strain ATCC 15264 / DSM 4735 / LMG 14903 / NBRC 16000 / CB 81) TaxID=633149 RepID=D9QIA6_BRESC|nr:hypothetical protein [Brevundimonas subvibrioides]ADK99408.1 hypothetical protein Bresu_0094 [Brevundimonas subvibrioides ATCC 15264]
MDVKKLAILLALTAPIAACATAPATYAVTNTRVLPDSKDVVWERAVEFFAMNNLSIKTIEKDSGIIAAERMIGSPSRGGMIGTWASCGSELLMLPVAQSVDLNVFVRSVPAGGTSITVNTDFTETRTFDASRTTVNCNSTGVLETSILDSVSGR